MACFVSMAMAGGVGNLSFTVFLKPLSAEFGWTRAQVSGGISAFMLAIALTAPFVGRAVGLYGPRAVMIPAAVLVGLCLMLLSQLTALWQLYLLRLGVGVGFTALAHVPVNIAISRWFRRKRGRAMGTAMIGGPVGGLLMTPFASSCVEWVGWRPTLLILGGLLWLILVPVLFGLLRDTPAELGLLPDGETRRSVDDTLSGAEGGEGISARDTLRTGRFWALIGIYFLAYGCLFSVMVHQYPYFTDQGFSAQQAALLVSVLLSASVISGLGFGWASERYDPLQLAAGCLCPGRYRHGPAAMGPPRGCCGRLCRVLRPLLWWYHAADRSRDRAYVRHESARRDLRVLSDHYLFERLCRSNPDGLSV